MVLVAGSAFATQPGNNGGGNGGCGVGQQTNGCGGGSPTGGAGGAGGQGGSGTGVGIGVGIASAQANAAAIAAQQQGQWQAQHQTATGGNAAATGGSGGSAHSNATGGNATGGAATGGQATGGNSGGNTITVEGDKGGTYIAPAQERNPVSTAYAAPLVSSNGTCMGSSSGGGQGTAFGLSFGTTWTDNNCDIRYDAEALRAAGLPVAAQARLCQKPEIAKAMEAAGTPCSGLGGGRRVSAAPQAPVAVETLEKREFTDPIIRARLGLPPL